MRGRISKFSSSFGVGLIAPLRGGAPVLFTINAIAGAGNPTVGRQVEYELYTANVQRPEAKRVVLS